MYSCSSSLLESRLTLRRKHLYIKQDLAYRIYKSLGKNASED